MPERPIIFSAPMVRALLAGTKTQTRRALKPQFPEWVLDAGFTVFTPKGYASGRGTYIDDAGVDWGPAEKFVKLPYWRGDRLWVREAWAKDSMIDTGVRYYATDDVHEMRKKRSPIHMPRWASRITLTVTNVRVQRLQDITEEDAIAEGLARTSHGAGNQWSDYPEGSSAAGWLDPRQSFRSLWNSLHGPTASDNNPWVAAITFTTEQRNIDA